MTAVAASGFSFVSWWQSCCVRGRAGLPARPRTQQDCHHETKVKLKVLPAVIELLMMGGKTPVTCWDVNKRQKNKLENFCIWFVIYLSWILLLKFNFWWNGYYMKNSGIKSQGRTTATYFWHLWIISHIGDWLPSFKIMNLLIPYTHTHTHTHTHTFSDITRYNLEHFPNSRMLFMLSFEAAWPTFSGFK